MRRKQYKLRYDVNPNDPYSSRQLVLDAETPAPKSTPDFEFNGVRYWFNELRSLGSRGNWAKPLWNEWAFLMDQCPRTGALMTLEAAKGIWYYQPEPVQKAFRQWMQEKHFTDQLDKILETEI